MSFDAIYIITNGDNDNMVRQEDREAALAVYAMAAQIVAARIATGGLQSTVIPGTYGLAIHEQAKALAPSANLQPIDFYADGANFP